MGKTPDERPVGDPEMGKVIEGAPADLGKCPWCGSGPAVAVNQSTAAAYTEWECGSSHDGGGPHQSVRCRIRELEAEVAAREARCAARTAWLCEWAEGSQAVKPPGEMTDYDLGWNMALRALLDLILNAPGLAASRLLAAVPIADMAEGYEKASPDECEIVKIWEHEIVPLVAAYREAKAAENAERKP